MVMPDAFDPPTRPATPAAIRPPCKHCERPEDEHTITRPGTGTALPRAHATRMLNAECRGMRRNYQPKGRR